MSLQQYIQAIQSAGHLLKRDDDGDIDMFAMSYEFHNGPVCELCHDCWCVHCRDAIYPCNTLPIFPTNA